VEGNVVFVVFASEVFEAGGTKTYNRSTPVRSYVRTRVTYSVDSYSYLSTVVLGVIVLLQVHVQLRSSDSLFRQFLFTAMKHSQR
jgi:hypothetical protein